ncbi:MAG: dihydrofolate reductase [Bacteroidales bacterium]|nr:dihydrofolate reductase [Bacteroidales bacterium]
MSLSIIVACAQNMAIGKNNDLLWHISDDLKRFKSLTSGHAVLMGRNTFDSLPKKPLPKRRNIVITHNPDFSYQIPDTATGTLEVVHSIQEALLQTQGEEEVFVIGGAAIYQQLLPLADKLYITWVYQDFQADVYFPEIDLNQFERVKITERQQDLESGLGFAYADYVRRK